jgi:hypothetical protein
MRRVLLGLALAVVTTVGTASADTFQILPQAPVNLPSASVPNQPGQISVPTPLSTPPAASQQLSFQELTTVWQGAGNAYGIPWQVLAAINKVESNFGRNMGPSSAGAVGWMQFMPSTWARWGVDANGDGIADPWNPQDAIYAAARYLAASGGSQDIARAVLSYNHAQWYVNEVLQLAQTFGSGGVAQTYQLDQLQVSLDKARSDVVQANKQLLAAELRDRILARAERRALLRTQNVPLLSAQLELQKAATLAGVRPHERRGGALAHAPLAGRERARASGDAGRLSAGRGGDANVRRADRAGELRVSGRRRPLRCLGRAHASRLSRRRHRGA